MITCAKCGAECREPKDEGRFQRRHPSKCQARARFNKELIQSIEASINKEILLYETAVDNLRPEDIDKLIKIAEGLELTPWEKGFMVTIGPQWERTRWLSDKQKEKLFQICQTRQGK